MAKRPEDLVCEAAVGLGRGLRAAGLPASVDQELLLCAALAEVDVRRRAQVHAAARAVFLRSPDDALAFEFLFDRFWRGVALESGEQGIQHGESDPRMPGPQHGGASLPQFRSSSLGTHLLDGNPSRASQEIASAGSEESRRDGRRPRRGPLAAYSPDDVASDREPLDYRRDELLAVRRLADALRAAAPERASRRLRPRRASGRLDVRETVRRSLATDGEPLRLAYAGPSRAPRRLLLICDVSGSMERYSRALLAALQAAVGAGLRAETFVFATRLTRLTPALGSRDAARALERARAAVTDWSGGTRIGRTLSDFNGDWGRRGLARGAIVIVVSDGWDRGDPALLARELHRLRLQARRLVWLNPRPGEVDGQPLAIGMRAALPYVDDFVAGHDPRAIERLAKVIGGLGSGRPARRQRALGLAS